MIFRGRPRFLDGPGRGDRVRDHSVHVLVRDVAERVRLGLVVLRLARSERLGELSPGRGDEDAHRLALEVLERGDVGVLVHDQPAAGFQPSVDEQDPFLALLGDVHGVAQHVVLVGEQSDQQRLPLGDYVLDLESRAVDRFAEHLDRETAPLALGILYRERRVTAGERALQHPRRQKLQLLGAGDGARPDTQRNDGRRRQFAQLRLHMHRLPPLCR